MSKNITIQEGGSGRQLTVDKLKTDLAVGGTCLWVPEDEMTLGTKNVTENGTYRAENDGYYGYSEVTVNGIGRVTGRDPTTGEDVTVTVDPETGMIVETVVPSEIRVTILPNKREYAVGDTMNYSGMVVKAYTATGALWTDATHPGGIITKAELTLPVTTITGEEEKKPDARGSGFDISPLPNPCPYTETQFTNTSEYTAVGNSYKDTYTFTPVSGKLVRMFGLNLSNDDTMLRSFFASNETGPLGVVNYQHVNTQTGVVIQERNTFVNAGVNDSFTYDGKTVYYANGTNVIIGSTNSANANVNNVPIVLWPNNTASADEVAWTIIYGNLTPGGSVIPVQWSRPGDGAVLETSFTITVA